MSNSVWKPLSVLMVMVFTPLLVYSQIQSQLEWNNLPPIPDQEGFAGMFVGSSNGALLAMGGANYPDGRPWEDGEKVWYDNIFVLEDETSSWKVAEKKLPRALAYGVSVTYDDKIIVVGGSDAKNHYRDVYEISYEEGEIHIEPLAPLPYGLSSMTGALVKDVLFIAGGSTSPDAQPGNTFLAFNIPEQEWMELDPWPGPGRSFAVSTSLNEQFFLFSGINIAKNAEGGSVRKILTDGYKFIPGFKKNRLTGGEWVPLRQLPRGVAAAPSPAPTVGLNHILFVGGLDSARAQQAELDPAAFPGLATELLSYHVESDSWLSFGNLPEQTTRLTAPTTRWNQKWVIPGGEQSPGAGDSQVFVLSKTGLQFGWGNWIAVILYMVILIGLGYYFSKRGESTQDYFKADGRVPWWAAGISIYGTQMSAITFMAVPALVFVTDWAIAMGTLMILAIVPILIKYYLPFFRRLNITSAYEYFGHRFDNNVRLLGSLSFILFQFGRMGVVLYLPAVAIASVTSIDIYLLLFVMGVISILYTVLGGIEAVIWTDVLQVIVLLGGALICIVIAVINIDGGLGGMIAKGLEGGKFTVIHLGWDPERLVLWVALVGFFFGNLIPYTSDQTVVQRYLTVKDEKAAASSLWTNGVLVIPGIFIFCGLGTALFIFYQDNPAIIPSDAVREVLPYYIVHKLPVGFAGIVIAGIFAASMSSLDSSMNSVATTYITDVHKRFWPGLEDLTYLRKAKHITVIVGVFGTASAMLVAALDVQILFDLFQEIIGVFGGSLAGLFILGIFTRRANTIGAFSGFIAGFVITLIVRYNTGISVYLYGAVGVISCVIVGYLISLLFPQKKSLNGLTYLTLNKHSAKKIGSLMKTAELRESE